MCWKEKIQWQSVTNVLRKEHVLRSPFLDKVCYTPLQYDFALDPMILPFVFHFSNICHVTTRKPRLPQCTNVLRKEHVLRPPFLDKVLHHFVFLMVICNSLLLLKSIPNRILFSIRNPYINRFTNHFSIHS
jgi:hypothetical protein